MTSAGVRFKEQMRGALTWAGDGSFDPTKLVLRCTITIANIETFLEDPEHVGSLDGALRINAISSNWLPAHGYVKLFSMGAIPGERLMEYQMEFEHSETNYILIGTKRVYDNPGLDAWRDVTTLHVSVLRLGRDGSKSLHWTGLLRLSLGQAVRVMISLRSEGGINIGAKLSAVAQFALFFLSELVERFFPASGVPRSPPK